VMDYKTGGGNLDPKSDWMRDRPIGLQLPFYASVLAQDSSAVAALVLARLHAKGPETKGLADADCGLPGLVSQREWPAFSELTWDELMARWRQTIQQLAQEYIEGHAVNRSLRADDIIYCDILPFLRLNEDYRRVE
jgi:ATP-dependent helicase/nuclease subunit B